MRHNRFYSGLLGVLLLVCGTAACGNNPAAPSSSEDTAAQSSSENTASTSSTETTAESAVTTQPETEEYDPNVLSKEEVQAIFAEDPEDEQATYYPCPPTSSQEFNWTSCYLLDPQGLKDELSELKWVKAEKTEYYDYYLYDCGQHHKMKISTGGLIEKELPDFQYEFYQLANIKDLDKLCEILDKYFVMDDYSKLSAKVNKGEYNFSNLTAHFTYTESQKENGVKAEKKIYNKNITGEFKCDCKKRITHTTGEGIYKRKESSFDLFSKNEKLVYTIHDKETGEEKTDKLNDKFLYFSYNAPGFEYFSVYQDLRYDLNKASFTAYNNSYDEKKCSFKSSKVKDGTKYKYSITYKLGNVGEYTIYYTVVLNENGNLLSYEKSYSDGRNFLYKLDDYEFDSKDFEMEDLTSNYEYLTASDER